MNVQRTGWGVAALVLALGLPWALSDYRVFQVTMVLVYAIALLGLNLLTGYSGQLSLGHGAFFAVGAYCAVILIDRAAVPYWATVPVAALAGFTAGVLFGRPALRLEGLYLALATFALAVATPQLLRERHLARWTGGVQGVVITKPEVPFGLPIGADHWLYLLVLALTVLGVAIARNLTRGRTGRALVAIRDHPVAAAAMGIDVARYKTLIFGVSAAYAAVGGALSAIVVQFVSPDSFTLALSITFLVGSVVGGVTSIAGAVYGAAFIQFVPLVAEHVSRAAPGAVFGMFLIATVFLMPRGIAGLLGRMARPRRFGGPLVPVAAAGAGLLVIALAGAGTARALPGVGPGEIRIGQTVPYSGPASNLGVMGHASAAYFAMVNARGGVNGRRIRLLSLDDGYSPPRTVEQTRKLVEREDVLLMFGSVGTACQLAVHRYLNAKGVPHLFLTTGASVWARPDEHVWTMPSNLLYDTEARAFARHILRERPRARIAVLYQNDDFGREYLSALRDELGAAAETMIVAERSYETTAPGVDSEMIALATSGADIFMNFSVGKYAAQAIRRAYESGWRPLQFINYNTSSIGTVLAPAGLEKAVGMITTIFQKTPLDPQWDADPEMREYRSWLARYYPEGDVRDAYIVAAYWRSALMTEVLRRAGSDLSRRNVLRQAASLQHVRVPMLLPGIAIDTGPQDYRPIEQYQFVRFDGRSWVGFGDVAGAPSPTHRSRPAPASGGPGGAPHFP
jgi:ABC-type branched-subunit amino acid transport system permease subunit/ABC-type branched-subunit amino acid transport system substrate-binding protein